MRISAINALVILGSLTLASANKKCVVKNPSDKIAVPGVSDEVKPFILDDVNEAPVEEVKNNNSDSEIEELEITTTSTIYEEVTVEAEDGEEASNDEAEVSGKVEEDEDSAIETSEIEDKAEENKDDAKDNEEVDAVTDANADADEANDDEANVDEADADEADENSDTDAEEVSGEVSDNDEDSELDSENETESVTGQPEEPSEDVDNDDPTKDFGSNGTCTFNDADREDCGFVGITEKECIYKGCCYKPTDISGKPWCYYSSTGELINSCAGIEDSEKVACKATTKDACAAEKGCCWKESNDESVPSCFYNRASVPNPDYNPDAIITVRFEKPKTWDSVCLWSWDGANNLYGGPDWPGKPIEDLGNGWWSHTFEKGVSVANVIFNNCDGGNTIKTNDITNVKTNTCFKLIGSVVIKTTDCGLDLDMCVADAEERVQCGSSKISKEDCIAQSCCYSELEGAPSCFYGKGSDYNNPHGTCIIDHTLRSMC
eukprot:jgi/Orpsp1_1/1177138/evm.model.c7180000060329.1